MGGVINNMDGCLINLKIPLGYRIIEKTKSVDLFTASEILRCREQRHITSVKREDNRAIITSHYIKCPYCGKETPSYSHYLGYFYHANHKKSEILVAEWADIQPSFFSAPEKQLDIQEFKDYTKSFLCQKCGMKSEKSNDSCELQIESIANKIYVKRELKTLKEITDIMWTKESSLVSFPMYEQVVFDFENKTVCLELVTKNETVSRIITDYPVVVEKSLLVTLIEKNKIIKRILKRLFKDVTGCTIPFSVSELDFKKFVLFLWCTGFDRIFYETPLSYNRRVIIDDCFLNQMKALQSTYIAMKVLENTNLPYCKSVKKMFAEKNSLFWFLKECEFLYSILTDVNLFCRLLKRENIVGFLSKLQSDIGVRSFLKEYSELMGKRCVFNNIMNNSYDLLKYAKEYYVLSEEAKEIEKERWATDKNFFKARDFSCRNYELLSTPMPEVPGFLIVKRGKYRFKWLVTKKDYLKASDKLANCLWSWDYNCNPVVVVSVGEKLVAAIEVSANRVVQARRKCNKIITEDSELYKVIKEWCEMNFLTLTKSALVDKTAD